MARVFALVLVASVALAAQAPPQPIAPDRFLAHVRWLSADELGGRGNGLDGLERAGTYVREQFRTAGLTGAVAGNFDQTFEAEVRIDPPADTSLIVTEGDARRVLALGRDFYPLSILERAPDASPPSADQVPVVFAGYGISAPGLHYDDYAEVDVRDAAVLVLTHEPQEQDARSVFAGRDLTPMAALSQKAREARERGARLLMVVEDPSHVDDRATRATWWTDPQSDTMGLPVLRVARDRVSVAMPGLDLTSVAAIIDRTLRPQSRRLESIRVSYVEHRAQFTARLRNIVGVLRGSDPALAREAVVVGAHYDHIGPGGALSEAPEATGQVHNGADDNASGVAALIEMARAAVRSRARFRRSVVFAAFAGEELGLRGSAHYVLDPAVALNLTRAMVNLDMVGRARGHVMVGTFGPRIPLAVPARLRLWTSLLVQDFARGGYDADASDVAPFIQAGVPAIAFFTGFHADYHRPSDDWSGVDAEGGAAIAGLALRLVEELSRQNASAGW
jgi:hypothetical protein